jgi:hypothetical protein
LISQLLSGKILLWFWLVSISSKVPFLDFQD